MWHQSTGCAMQYYLITTHSNITSWSNHKITYFRTISKTFFNYLSRKIFGNFVGLNWTTVVADHIYISLSDLTCHPKSYIFFFEKKNELWEFTLRKCSNFFVFQPILIKLILESDLVLNRSFPESFYDLMIFDTPYAHISEKIDDFGSHPQNHQFFGNMSIGVPVSKIIRS